MFKGWSKGTGINAGSMVKKLEPYCSEFLFTCIEREGKMRGTNLEFARKLSSLASNKKSFAGGIISMGEIEALEKMGCNSVLGMSFYSGRISLKEIQEFNEIDFCKGKGLIPAIAQDEKNGTVLMLAYMNRESLRRTMETGNATYWSRSRLQLWEKGATSGNLQKVKSILLDCDKDAILLKVKQNGVACHTGNYSCFFNKKEEIR